MDGMSEVELQNNMLTVKLGTDNFTLSKPHLSDPKRLQIMNCTEYYH